MERVYFDKQIFSYLYNGTETIYKKFLSDIYANKGNFLFCYSHGHMLDLKNDKSDIKFKELEFIETIVGDNYLSYHALDKVTSCYLARPIEAFNDLDDFDEYFDILNVLDEVDLSGATTEQKEQFETAKNLLINQKFDFGLSQIKEIPEDMHSALSKIIPENKSEMSLLELTEHFMEMLRSMLNDKSTYKDMRNMVDKSFNNGKFTLDFNNIDFNDDLKNSALKKSFTEFVNNNLNPNGDKKISNYDFYTNAYFSLDLLGISKEPSKKVKFRNVMNDAFHSYYGAFCDYVVSDDQGFLKKTKAMYKLLNIKTEVFEINEFISYFSLLSKNYEDNLDKFIDLINNDLKNGIVTNSKPSIKYNRHTTTIKTYHKYLGHFNTIDSIKEENREYICLYRSTNNYSYFDFYREYEGVVNKAIKLFGADTYFRGEYDWNKENTEIKEEKWSGRFWDFGDFTLLLEINKGLRKLCLLITLKN